MTIWDWIDDFFETALSQGDQQRARLPLIHSRGYELRETDPEQTLALFEEGKRLSLALNEPWWTLFFDDWCVTAYEFFLRDYRTVLDRAVHNALELRKPAYTLFPMRFSIQRNLVHAYISIDPKGYADRIEDALSHLEETTPVESDDQYLIFGSRREYALELNDLELAEQTAHDSLKRADSDEESLAWHYLTFCYCGLCEIAWRRRDWQALKDAANEGEELAKKSKLQMEMTELILWQAVAAQQEQNEERAGYLYRRAKSRLSRLRMPADRGYHEALCGYHLLNERLDKAISTRRRELRLVENKGRHWYEARSRLKLCELLAEQGSLTEEEREQARQCMLRLQKPEELINKLNQIG